MPAADDPLDQDSPVDAAGVEGKVHMERVAVRRSDSLLITFTGEAQEAMQRLSADLRILSERPGDMDSIRRAQQAPHNLASLAEMMGFDSLGKLCGCLEDVLVTAEERKDPLTREQLGVLHRAWALIVAEVNAIASGGRERLDHRRILTALCEAFGMTHGGAA